MSAAVDARRRRVKGTAATTRNRPVVCTSCNITGRYAFGPLMRVGMPICGGCRQPMEWGTAEDAMRAGVIDARTLPAAELRALGWEDLIHRRSPGRKSRQKQCDNGCGRFIASTADKCAGGHWQKAAIKQGRDQWPF